jgi:hypothetical protein
LHEVFSDEPIFNTLKDRHKKGFDTPWNEAFLNNRISDENCSNLKLPVSQSLDSLKFHLISSKVFEQEMRKIFKLFLIIFDQKSLNHVIWFFKEYIKICGHQVE